MFTFRLRRGTTTQWSLANPVLQDGEPGVETNTNKFKIGDGVHKWADLPYYLSEEAISQYVNEAVTDVEAGGADLPDLALLWENAKV